MISILLVEDNTDKRMRIARALLDVNGVDRSNIHQATDVQSAKKMLRAQSFDLLVLDIVLPQLIDSDVSPTAGVELLQEVLARPLIYKIPADVIGITAFDNVFEAADLPFSSRLLNLIQYDASSTDWEHALQARVNHIIESKHSRLLAVEDFRSHIAVICALHSPEFTAVLKLPWHWEQMAIPHDHTPYWQGWFEQEGERRLVYAGYAPEMGMSASAVLATKMIHTFRPKYLVMAGVTAGVSGKAEFGDVIAADRCWDWGSGKYITSSDGEKFLQAPNQITLSVEVKEQLKALSRNHALLSDIRQDWPSPPAHTLSLRVGPMASGASVLADNQNIKRIINQHRQLLGVEMEAYGVFAAAEEASEPRPKPVVIKSVVDFADGEKDDKYQHYAAYTSAQVLLHVSKNLI